MGNTVLTTDEVPEFQEGGVTQYPVTTGEEVEKPVTKIGVTKKSHEESKARRRMAQRSRKINRRK